MSVTIPTERSLNRMVHPVVEKSRFKQSFPVKIGEDFKETKTTNLLGMDSKNAKKEFIIDNYWDHRNFMIMDILTDKLTSNIFGKYKKLNDINTQAFKWTDKEINDVIENGDAECIGIRRRDFTKIPYFHSVSNKRILAFLNNISDCRLSGFYNYRYFNEEMGKFYNKKIYIENDKIIDSVEYDDNENVFYLHIGSTLGKLFILNVGQMNIDFIDSSLYSLNKYSQMLYRYIQSYKNNNNNVKNLRINITEICNKIGMLQQNPTTTTRLIDKYIHELHKNGFIKNYKIANDRDNKYNRKKASIDTYFEIDFN